MAAASGAITPGSASAAAKPAASASIKPSVSSSSGATAAAAGPIKVGVLEPLTGPLADLGKDNQDGLNLFLESINSTVAGRKIEPVYADDQGRGDTGLTKAKQLVESDKVAFMAGITAPAACYPVAQYTAQMQAPLVVTGNCDTPHITTDPKYASPYLMHFTLTAAQGADPAADWAYKQGFRKAILFTADFVGGLETADAIGSALIERGGSIIQELYPPQGTADFGTYVAQLNPQADVIFSFFPGTDGLRFVDQYGNYAGAKRIPIIDTVGVISSGANLAQLKQKADGLVSSTYYTEALDSPMNQAFLKAFHAKFPGRGTSKDLGQGYASGQIIEAALKKVNIKGLIDESFVKNAVDRGLGK